MNVVLHETSQRPDVFAKSDKTKVKATLNIVLCEATQRPDVLTKSERCSD